MKQKLLLVPGLLNDRLLWSFIEPYLAKNYDIIHAKTTGFTDISLCAEHILQDIEGNFAVIGLSMGGYITFELIKQASDRISHIGLLNTNSYSDTDEQKRLRKLAISQTKHGKFEGVTNSLLKKIVAKRNHNDDNIISIVQEMAQNIGVENYVMQQNMIMERPDYNHILADIKQPTLCLVGEEDEITPTIVMQSISKKINHSYYIEVPKTGHLSPLESPLATLSAINMLLQVPSS